MNRIPLRSMVKAKHPRKKVLRLPVNRPTRSQGLELAAIYLRPVAVWERAVERLTQQYARALSVADGLVRDDAEWLKEIIDAILGEVTAEIRLTEALFRGWLNSMVRWHTSRIVSGLRYAADVDLSFQLQEVDMAETLEELLARNVGLVRSVSDSTRDRISDIVYRGLTARTPTREVGRQIREATGLSRKRALRIAADQTNKVSAALDRQRMRQLGFTGGIWRHSGKLHYRPEHKARDGKFFLWEDPVMKADPPGYAPFCGCAFQASMELD